MTSVRQLREFVTDRLTAAAEEIFREFEKTIAEYQDEIERQRRLLDVVWKPEVKLRRIELLLQQDSKDEEVPTQQQLCNQERNSNLDQEEPEPPQIKREQVELRSSQDVEELFPGQWTETSKIKLPCDVAFKSQIKPCSIELQQLHVYKEEELFYDQQFCNQEKNPHLDQEEPEPPQIKDEQKELCGSQEQEQEQLVLRQGTETFMMIPPHQESDRRKPEQSRDHQFFSPSSAVVENQDQKGSQRVESGSTRNTEPEPKKKCYKNTGHMHKGKNSPLSVTKRNNQGPKKLLECDFCEKTFKIKYLLEKHMRVHTGEKAYLCSICGDGYDLWPQFQLHMKTVHTEEKPYLCTTCGDRFFQLSHLTNHVKVHTREETYIKTHGSPFRLYLNMRRAQSREMPRQCNT